MAVPDPRRIGQQPWADQVEVVQADLTDPATLPSTFDGVQVAYYPVHALGTGRSFGEIDRPGADVFGRAVRTAGTGRIVYLGGLTHRTYRSSGHLRSRAEVGCILRSPGVPTAKLRAAIILGSSSVSFEMLHYPTERLRVMVTPIWVLNRMQPIGVRDVLPYLVEAASLPEELKSSIDIDGPEMLTYREMMLRYAAVAGLPRRVMCRSRCFPALTVAMVS